MKTIKGLTKANAGKYGFEVRPDLDFEDDGAHFRGFSYKGLPLTQCRYAGDVYLAIRPDYALGRLYEYKEWRCTEEHRLADEFNGVPEVDVEKLIANCEAVLAKCISIRKAAAKARLENK